MVADEITVVSHKHGTNEAHTWTSDGQTGFKIASAKRETTGTDVILKLRKDAKEFLEQERISYLVKKYSDHIAQPISWLKKGNDPEQLNSSIALWTRAPKDISEEEYKNFYHDVASSYDSHLPPCIIAPKELSNSISCLFPLLRP